MKYRDHEFESHNKFKNCLLKITQLSPWQIVFGHFFARFAIFVKQHFLRVSYLSISYRVFIMCRFCKVTLFWNSIKRCHFCWVYLMAVNLQLFTVLAVVWRENSDKKMKSASRCWKKLFRNTKDEIIIEVLKRSH